MGEAQERQKIKNSRLLLIPVDERHSVKRVDTSWVGSRGLMLLRSGSTWRLLWDSALLQVTDVTGFPKGGQSCRKSKFSQQALGKQIGKWPEGGQFVPLDKEFRIQVERWEIQERTEVLPAPEQSWGLKLECKLRCRRNGQVIKRIFWKTLCQ